MVTGRLPYNAYVRCVEKNGGLQTEAKGSRLKEGCFLVTSSKTTCQTEESLLELFLVRAKNELAALCAEEKEVVLSASFPETLEENSIRLILKKASELCKKWNTPLRIGDIQTLNGINMPVITWTAIGWKKEMEKEKPAPGDGIVMTKATGLSGTHILSEICQEKLKKRFLQGMIDSAQLFRDYISIIPEAAVAGQHGEKTMQPVGEGGILAALWDLSVSLKMGFEVDLLKIPIRQETVEFAEYLDFNPYQIAGDGALLIVTKHPEELADRLKKEGQSAQIIGYLTETNGKIIKKDDEVSFLDRPKQDELFRYL